MKSKHNNPSIMFPQKFYLNLAVSLFLIILGSFSTTLVFAGTPAVTPELLKQGETSYKTNCLTCHGEHGDGMGPAGQYLNPKPRNFTKDKFKAGDKVEQVFKTVSKGLPNTAMVAYGHLPEAERWALAHYVLSFRKKK